MKIKLLLASAMIGGVLIACGPPPDLESLQPRPQPDTQSYPYPAPATESPPGRDPAAYPGVEVTAQSRDAGEVPKLDGRIAFHSERAGSLQLYVLDGNSGIVQPLTTDASKAYEPSWSPDCEEIVYSHEVSGRTDSDLYIVALDEQITRPLVAEPDTFEWEAEWSPVGGVIAYQTNPEALMNVCLRDTNGGDLGCLARENYSNAHPSWSPDGSKLLFISNRDGDWEVYLTGFGEGDEPVKLTDNSVADLHPRFSPDADFIVYETNLASSFDIYLMDADGSGTTPVTTDERDDRDPFWFDNETILFASDRTSDWELYTVNRGGNNLQRITYQPGLDRGPVWCAND